MTQAYLQIVQRVCILLCAGGATEAICHEEGSVEEFIGVKTIGGHFPAY